MMPTLSDQGAGLDLLLNQIAHGVLVCNIHGEILFLNAAAQHLIAPPLDGLSTATASTVQVTVCDPTGQVASLEDWTLAHALQGKTIKDCEGRIVRPDGSYADILVSGTPLLDAQRQVIGAVLTWIDITERKQAEQIIRQSMEDLNRAQAVALTGSWRLDVQHNKLVWSDETHRMFGVSKDTSLTYETFLDTIHPDDRDAVDRAWRAALRGEPYDIEHRIVVSEAIKWVRERVELEFDEQGNLLGGFGTVQDITERKRAEEQRQSIARFPSENPNPILRVSNQGIILYANEASAPVQAAWGSKTGETLTQPWYDIVAELARSGRTHELELVCGNITFLLEVVPIADSDYLNIYGRDVTERKQAEQRNLELLAERERKRVLTDFVQNLSHDFRTPLATINLSLHLLDRSNPENQQHHVAVIQQQTQRLATLVDYLLTIIRLERDTDLNFGPVNLNTLVEGMHTSLQVIARQQSVRLYLNQSQEVLWVTGDGQKLERALRELAVNALQFTPSGGSVTLSLFAQGDMAVIDVQDSGPGIEADVLPHIFEHLYRGDNARSAASGGLGLGLTIAQKIVQIHRGRIEVSSTLKQGTTFQMWLPRTAAM
jgi:PAS domain S-box-containing protein